MCIRDSNNIGLSLFRELQQVLDPRGGRGDNRGYRESTTTIKLVASRYQSAVRFSCVDTARSSYFIVFLLVCHRPASFDMYTFFGLLLLLFTCFAGKPYLLHNSLVYLAKIIRIKLVCCTTIERQKQYSVIFVTLF